MAACIGSTQGQARQGPSAKRGRSSKLPSLTIVNPLSGRISFSNEISLGKANTNKFNSRFLNFLLHIALLGHLSLYWTFAYILWFLIFSFMEFCMHACISYVFLCFVVCFYSFLFSFCLFVF